MALHSFSCCVISFAFKKTSHEYVLWSLASILNYNIREMVAVGDKDGIFNITPDFNSNNND